MRTCLWGNPPANRLGTRRLLALVKGLPPGSATHRAENPDTWAWTSTEELLAGLIESSEQANRLFVMANSPAGTQPPPPVHIPRPWEDPEALAEPRPARPQSSVTEMKRFFGATVVVPEVPEEPN